jgi:peroxidase
VIIWC